MKDFAKIPERQRAVLATFFLCIGFALLYGVSRLSGSASVSGVKVKIFAVALTGQLLVGFMISASIMLMMYSIRLFTQIVRDRKRHLAVNGN